MKQSKKSVTFGGSMVTFGGGGGGHAENRRTDPQAGKRGNMRTVPDFSSAHSRWTGAPRLCGTVRKGVTSEKGSRLHAMCSWERLVTTVRPCSVP